MPRSYLAVALVRTIGQSIETLYAGSLDDNLSNLAHHCRRSGNTAKAVDHLVRAAYQALQRSALSVASEYFEDVSEVVRALPGGAERCVPRRGGRYLGVTAQD